MRCCVAPQLVGNHPPRHTALTLEQLAEEPFSRTSIAARLEQNVDHVAVLIDRTPEILPPPLDGEEEFVQVPRVAQTTLVTLERTGVLGTELQTPQSDALVGDDDPPLCQEIFDISEAQAEAVVEPTAWLMISGGNLYPR